jgi:hypothetical protein
MRLRVSLGLPAAVEHAARQEYTSGAEYARRALLTALSARGLHLLANGKVAVRNSDQ